jgi:hypothetical protein
MQGIGLAALRHPPTSVMAAGPEQLVELLLAGGECLATGPGEVGIAFHVRQLGCGLHGGQVQDGVVSDHVLFPKCPPIVGVVEMLRQAEPPTAIDLPLGGLFRRRPELIEILAVAYPHVLFVNAEDEGAGAVAHRARLRHVHASARSSQVFIDETIRLLDRGISAQFALLKLGKEQDIGQGTIEVNVHGINGRAGKALILPPAAVFQPHACFGHGCHAVDQGVLEPVGQGIVETEPLPLEDRAVDLRQPCNGVMGNIVGAAPELAVVVAHALAAVHAVWKVPGENEVDGLALTRLEHSLRGDCGVLRLCALQRRTADFALCLKRFPNCRRIIACRVRASQTITAAQHHGSGDRAGSRALDAQSVVGSNGSLDVVRQMEDDRRVDRRRGRVREHEGKGNCGGRRRPRIANLEGAVCIKLDFDR